MLKPHAASRVLALILSCAALACAPSGGDPPPPPPDAGADPTGRWQVQLLLSAIAGQCDGTTVQNEFWEFVPDGQDQWIVEVQDFTGFTLGTLQARQSGIELIVTGQLVISGGVTVREYQSNGLYATPSSLTGHMNITRTGSVSCAQWGPLTGVPTSAGLTHGDDSLPLDGTLSSSDGLGGRARLHELEPDLFQLSFEHAGTVILSPPLPLLEGGSLHARFHPAGTEHEYELTARLESRSLLRGHLLARSDGEQEPAWRATLSLQAHALETAPR